MSADVAQKPLANGFANGHVNGGAQTPAQDVEMNGTPTNEPGAAADVPRFATGLILPPPEIKIVADRTASFVARSADPGSFEDKVRENHKSDPKFSFLNPVDPYHAYYRNKMERIMLGEEDGAAATKEGAGEGGDAKEQAQDEAEEEKLAGGIVPLEPSPPEFILDVPPISALDLDIIKLTALFTARRGRPFIHSLAQKESRNYEFDFLRPTHSLFGHFNSLVEQYSKVLLPSKDMLEKLQKGSEEGARWRLLEVSKQHAEFEKLKREREKKRADDKEAERIAFAEIDWHDYAIVQTIEFTTADNSNDLPPPMTVDEMVSRMLAQKKMAAMIMEDTAEEIEANRQRQAAEDSEAAAKATAEADGGMDVSEDEDDVKERKRREEEERQRELERARAIQATSMDSSGPMKIRTDYVPKLGANKGKVTMTTCTICGQQIPVDELQEHMRIELLDPRWKSQRDQLEARRAQLSELQKGANIEQSLKRLARARTDIFGTEEDEEKRKQEEALEQERRREREKVVWDGHTASKEKTMDKFSMQQNFDEQIAQIHRAKGLGPMDPSASGPSIGPSAGPGVAASLPPPPPSLPANPHQNIAGTDFGGASVAVAAQPASMGMPMYGGMPPQVPGGGPPPVMLPPLHYSGVDPSQPFTYTPPMGGPGGPVPGGPPMGMHPSRMAALASGGTPTPPPQTGMVRTADQMMMDANGEPVDDGVPPAKRQRVQRLPGGQYYPEESWIEWHKHPISIQIQLPVDTAKPEYKLDGSVVTLEDIPVTFVLSTVREHLARHIGSSMPLSRIILSFEGKMLANATSLAGYNIEDGDMLVLSLRDAKKKK